MASQGKRNVLEAEYSRDAVQLRDNVLAIVAHDLRSPISTILNAAELLRDEYAASNTESHFLDIITSAAQQADCLIQDLVDMTRIESGRFAIELTREPVAGVVSAVAEMFAQQAAHAGIMYCCDATNVQGLMVQVDHSRFVQLLSNLIDNAIKFSPPGGRVSVTAVPENGGVKISVHDTGIGISLEELPHVFERFWQANRSQRAGAGLGLAIAKGIVEAHGGHIGVDSVKGIGSTFFFTLPLAESD